MHPLHHIHPVITHVSTFMEHYRLLGYWAVFFVSFLESFAFVGAFIPGALFVVLMGALAAKGFYLPVILIGFAAPGAILGDILSYYLGRRGTKLFGEENKILKLSHLEQGENFFKKHGNKSVFLGRFIGLVRAIIPFVAGLFKMEKKKFFFWDILSGLAWAIVYIYLGFFFGQAWKIIEIWTNRIGYFLVILSLFFFLFWLLKRFILRQGRQIAAISKSLWSSIKQGVASNQDMEKFVSKHPKVFGFLKRRFQRQEFSGLTLTFLSLAFVYLFFLFSGVIIDILSSDFVLSIDQNIVHLFIAFRHPWAVRFFLWVTVLGRWETTILFTAIFSLLLLLWRKREYLIPFWISISGSAASGFLAKLIFHRPRPEDPVYIEPSYSFPSGHSIVAVALYGYMIYFFWRNVNTWKNKINVLFGGLLVILAIGFSRLYLGVHFLSDVWGGYLLGGLWLVASIGLSEKLLFRKKERIYTWLSPLWLRTGTAVLVLTGAVSYVVFARAYKPPFNISMEEPVQIVAQGPIEVFSANGLPRNTETLTGNVQEPLNFLIVARDDDELLETFKKAGWYSADPINFTSMNKIIRAVIFNQSYVSGPISPYFWNTEVNDFGFEKPTETNSARQRHHARFWRTDISFNDGTRLYVGSASLDVGMNLVTHRISPDIDTEREFLLSNLMKSGLVTRYERKQFTKPLIGQDYTGDQYFTDGKSYVIYLK